MGPDGTNRPAFGAPRLDFVTDIDRPSRIQESRRHAQSVERSLSADIGALESKVRRALSGLPLAQTTCMITG